MKAGSSSHRFLAINLKDPDGFLQRQSFFKAMWMKANMGMVGTPVTIVPNTLPLTLEELLEAIRRKHPEIQIV
jgi:hypothetical protein